MTVSYAINDLLSAGLDFHKKGELAEAERYYQMVLAQDGTHVEALRLTGIIGYQTGNFTAAEPFFVRAVNFSPMSTQCRKNHAANLLALGKAEEAILEFSAVIRMSPNVAEGYFDRAVAKKTVGDYEGAIADYKKALALDPGHFGAHNNIANLFKELARNDEAKEHYNAAFALNPQHPEILNNLGVLELAQGEIESAAEKFMRAHELSPNALNPIKNLADALVRLGQYQSAEICFTRAVGINGTDPALWFGYGKLLDQLDRKEQALECYRRAFTLDVHATDAVLAAVKIFFDKKLYRECISILRPALENNPDVQEVAHNLALCLFESGERQEGLALLEKGIELEPNRFELHNNLGNFLRVLGDREGALEAFKRAIALSPTQVDPIYNMGVLFENEQQYEEAEKWYRKALAIDPGALRCNWNLALVLLTMGKYLEGWKQYEWRWKWPEFTSPRRNFPQPQWYGEDLTGKTLLVHSEQGMGDAIQFVRYVPLIQANQEKVILEIPAQLMRLMKGLKGAPEDVYRYGDDLPWFDRQIPTMSLPVAFGTTLETVPANTPYIEAESAEVSRWKERISSFSNSDFRIGIVWAGNALHHKDAYRSTQFNNFLKLAGIPGVQLYSLQKGEEQKQLLESAEAGKVINLMDEIDDFAETLGLMSNLDLIITVDTSIAHLAGAAALPVWILLAHDADYRWMIGREDTPWYPTAKLFRQPHEGDWNGVFNLVERALRMQVGSR